MVSVIIAANVEQYASLAPKYTLAANVTAIEINPNGKGIVEDMPTGAFPPPLVTDPTINSFVYDV